MTLFEKIINREIPADILWEDEEVLAFRDIHPQAPVHILVIPKKLIPNISAAQKQDAILLGRLLLTAAQIAEDMTENGFRLVINKGREGGETVPHLHIHILGGRSMTWPPG